MCIKTKSKKEPVRSLMIEMQQLREEIIVFKLEIDAKWFFFFIFDILNHYKMQFNPTS
jgi:hypothetical protein